MGERPLPDACQPLEAMHFHATYFTYNFTTIDDPRESVGRITSIEGIGDVYHHNVANYRETPKWRKITRDQFHSLMNTAKEMKP